MASCGIKASLGNDQSEIPGPTLKPSSPVAVTDAFYLLTNLSAPNIGIPVSDSDFIALAGAKFWRAIVIANSFDNHAFFLGIWFHHLTTWPNF